LETATSPRWSVDAFVLTAPRATVAATVHGTACIRGSQSKEPGDSRTLPGHACGPGDMLRA
jgi:hypothetical protein